MVHYIEKINGIVNGFVWGPIMLVFFLFVGLMFTVRTKFFQITNISDWLGTTFISIFKNKDVRKTKDKKAISQFQALATALAATVGTGNIAGVATAIVLGGPGAVFWMWLSAFFGMMTNYAENTLGIKYRYKNEKGDWIGGAMVYIERGLNWKILAVIFSVFCVLASFGIGNMSQINSISSALKESFNIPLIATGIVIAVLVAFVIIGGIKRIASITEKIVPFMVLVYFIGGIICIFANVSRVPEAFGMIFTEAFNFKAATGGVLGYGIMVAMRRGISRGVFSNEAGLGSSVMVHSASNVKEPVVQGMWGIFEVFADTLVVCTITALVILTSKAYNYDDYMDFATQKSAVTSQIIKDANGEIKESSGSANELEIIVNNTLDRIKKETNSSNSGEVRLYNANDTVNTILKSASDKVKASDKQAFLELSAKIKSEFLDNVTDVKIYNGAPLTSKAFASTFGHAGGMFVSLSIMLFAFSTILGWSYYGERAMEYMFGLKSVPFYKAVFTVVLLVGAVSSLELVWDISDTFNGLMAIPNLIGVTFLSGEVIKMTKDYLARKKSDEIE